MLTPVHQRRVLTAALLVAMPPVLQAQDSTIVTGTVRGADQRIPVRADVEVAPTRDAARAVRVIADSLGRFRVAIAAPGPYRLRAAGVGYAGMERSLPVDGRTTLSLALTLGGMPAGMLKGPVIGATSEEYAEPTRPGMPPAVILERGTDGVRRGTLRAKKDTVAYRVIDVTARTFVAPAGAPAYRWAPDGEYEGLLLPSATREVSLVFDPSLLAFGGASALRVTEAHPLAAALAQLDSLLGSVPARTCLLAVQAPPIDPADAVLADTSLAARLQLVRRLLVADARCQVHPALGQRVLEQFAPGSALWRLDDLLQRRVVLVAARHASGESRFTTPSAAQVVRERFDAAIGAAAQDTALRRDLFAAAAVSFMPADTLTARTYTARLVDESPDDGRVAPLLRLTGYNRVLRPGQRVPPFRLAALDGTGAPVTDVQLRGKVYLMDIWATWCVDCIVEMPQLRALHQRYRARGLTILSASVDEARETADSFRKGRESMPWLHGWAGNAPDGPLAAFDVQWLPTTILVGRDGRILAFSPHLDSPEFRATLEKALR